MGRSDTQAVALPNITELKAIETAKDHECAVVLGWHAPGDGGGGHFYWDAGSEEADDGGTCIRPGSRSGPGRWKRLRTDNTVNVRWFGATGGGTSDDYQAIQNAIDNCRRGERLLIPAGEYAVAKRLHVEVPDLVFEGEGALTPHGDMNDYLIEFVRGDRAIIDQDLFPREIRFRVERLKIRGQNRSRGVFISHVDSSLFSNINIEGTAGTAMRIHSCRETDFINTEIIRCKGNGEAILDMYQRSREPDHLGGTRHCAEGYADATNNFRFYGLNVVLCDAKCYLDIGIDDPKSEYAGGWVRSMQFTGLQIHQIPGIYYNPGDSRDPLVQRSIAAARELFVYEGYAHSEDVSMIRIRNAVSIHFSHSNFPNTDCSGCIVQLGDEDAPAVDCVFFGCRFVASFAASEYIEANNVALDVRNAEGIKAYGCTFKMPEERIIRNRGLKAVQIIA